jgi:hypothetical protein
LPPDDLPNGLNIFFTQKTTIMKPHKTKVPRARSKPEIVSAALFAAFFAFVSIPLKAQKRWSVEVRPSLNFPVNTGNRNINTGFGIEGKTFFAFMPRFSTYAGWGWNLFPAMKRTEFSYEETGYMLGLHFMHPVSGLKMRFYVEGAGIYSQVETENKEPGLHDDSDHGLGWQLESGFVFPVADKLLIKPGIRYRNVASGNLNYFSFGFGLMW